MALPTTIESPQRTSADEKRSALETVLASSAFARADQLRSFLRFICKMELDGRGNEISEYMIAVEALGRSEDFSNVEDSSVRVMARSLRQKLDEFYAHEGQDAGIRIEIVKGSYQPRFVRIPKSQNPEPGAAKSAAAPGASHIHDKPSEPGQTAVRRERSYSLLWFLAGIALALAAAFLFTQLHRTAPAASLDPIVRDAWFPIAQRDANVLIAIGNPLHMIFHPFPVLLPDTVQEYPAPAGTYPYYRTHKPFPPDAKLSIQTVDNAVSMGQVLGVVTAVRLLDSAGASYQVLPEHTAPLPSLRARNVVLIGNPEDSAAVAALLADMPLSLEFDPRMREILVRDRKNNRTYAPKRDSTGHYAEVYGLITVLPSEGFSERSQKTMVFSGITSVGSNAAVEFMASPRSLRSLLEVLRKEGYSSFPGSYQVLVRAATTPETLLVSTQYEAHVVLDKPGSK